MAPLRGGCAYAPPGARSRNSNGLHDQKLTLNTDFLPTFTTLAGVQKPPYVDGRSLGPVLKGNATSWRNAILLEAASNYSPAYRGIRTANTATTTERKYVEYSSGARELYNLEVDPYELRNGYRASTPPSGFASRLKALKTCSGDAAAPEDTCQVAEDGP